jgi:hypothetical protein
MTTKNSILLIIKQNPGIDYNSLLAKISSNYSSINSARAALSRALKDSTAFGLVVKEKNRFFVTSKGIAELSSEMKAKLLIKLNQALKSSSPDIDLIVENLQILIQRSKIDSGLLKTAKGNAEFYIKDLIELNKSLEQKIKHFSYLSKVLEKQVSFLQELNFNDLKEFEFKKGFLPKLSVILKLFSLNEFLVESNSEQFLEEIAKKFDSKPKGNTLTLNARHLLELLELVEKEFFSDSSKSIDFYFSQIRVKVVFPVVQLIGPFNELRKLLNEMGLK